MVYKNSHSLFLSHRVPQVLAAILFIFTLVQIPLTIATLGVSYRSPVFRTITMNLIYNLSLIYCVVETVSGVHLMFGRRTLNLGFEFLQMWGAIFWAILSVLYIYVVVDLSIRVNHSRDPPTCIAALVFGCFQLVVSIIGLALRLWKAIAEQGGRISLDDVPPPLAPRKPDYGTTSGTGLYVQIDPNGVNDEEERRRLL